MLKRASHTRVHQPEKRGSIKSDYQGPLASGLNRRAFLKTSTAIALLGGLPACKPQAPQASTSETPQAVQDNSATRTD